MPEEGVGAVDMGVVSSCWNLGHLIKMLLDHVTPCKASCGQSSIQPEHLYFQ